LGIIAVDSFFSGVADGGVFRRFGGPDHYTPITFETRRVLLCGL
jgi:hypothetical protein